MENINFFPNVLVFTNNFCNISITISINAFLIKSFIKGPLNVKIPVRELTCEVTVESFAIINNK